MAGSLASIFSDDLRDFDSQSTVQKASFSLRVRGPALLGTALRGQSDLRSDEP